LVTSLSLDQGRPNSPRFSFCSMQSFSDGKRLAFLSQDVIPFRPWRASGWWIYGKKTASAGGLSSPRFWPFSFPPKQCRWLFMSGCLARYWSLLQLPVRSRVGFTGFAALVTFSGGAEFLPSPFITGLTLIDLRAVFFFFGLLKTRLTRCPIQFTSFCPFVRPF